MKILCAWCLAAFPVYSEESLEYKQALGCASSVGRAVKNARCGVPEGTWILCAAYGSSFDTKYFRFLRNEPTNRADPICDNCIRDRMDDLEQIPGRYL